MNTKITRPDADEYAPYYHTYISQIQSNNLIEALKNAKGSIVSFLQSIPLDKLDYRYQADKWSIKEIIIHLMDAERIFMYRALRFARNDSTSVSGFDENDYAAESNAADRSLQSLLDEYTAVRHSTIEFFKNIPANITLRSGIANGKQISVRALGFVIAGHELHHMAVIRERYL
jgi:uncharacterized damage-inducible protein DinB